MKMSIIIPCYNERENIIPLVKVLKEMDNYGDLEFVIVENGSTDDSRQILDNAVCDAKNIRVVYVETNKGYGYGIVQGLKNAAGIYVGWTHGDMQLNPKDILKAYHFLERQHWKEKFFIKGVRKKENRSIPEIILTFGMGIAVSVILRKRMYDVNGQPNIFPKSFFNKLETIPDDVVIEIYVYYMAKYIGLSEARMAVEFGKRKSGNSKLAPSLKSKLKTIIRTLAYTVELRRKMV